MAGLQPRATLWGRRVLVAEDEYMIADDIADMLQAEGAEPIGPMASVADLLSRIAADSDIDGALLDVNLRNELVWPVVDAMLARQVPVVLSTGYDASVIPAEYAHLPRCEKPSSRRELVGALSRALAKQDGATA